MTDPKPETKPTTAQLGENVKAKTVVRPDGMPLTVTGGDYVLSMVGTYLVDGTQTEVK